MKMITLLYKTDVPNLNGHIYPREVVKRALEEYKTKMIDRRHSTGELQGPARSEINLTQASHLVTGYEECLEGYLITSKVLDTPMGKVLETLLGDERQESFIKYGMVSTGTLNNNVVGDMKIISIDILPNGGEEYNART